MKKFVPSIDILQWKLTEFFSNEGIPSAVLISQRTPPSDEVFSNTEDIVLTGNGLNLLMDYKRFPSGKFIRLWVLCNSFKKVLVNFLGFPDSYIGVIPRYELFPQEKDNLTLENSDSFVYAGRFLREKNISKMLSFLSLVQRTSFFKNHKIYLLGDAFEEGELMKYRFKRRPEFLGSLGQNWASRQKFKKSVFINFSTYRFEDFSVAAAQAQQNGMAVLTSRWQAFQDLQGEVWHFPADLMFKKTTDEKVADLVYNTIKKIEVSSPQPEFYPPCYIPCKEILERFNSLGKIDEAKVRGYFGFTGLPQEHQFFNEIHSHFTGEKTSIKPHFNRSPSISLRTL